MVKMLNLTVGPFYQHHLFFFFFKNGTEKGRCGINIPGLQPELPNQHVRRQDKECTS